MNVELKPIAYYRTKYKVIAGFYKNKRDIDSRIFADIYEEGCIENNIEAYIIMINPGSCKPVNGDLDKDIINSAFYSGIKLDLDGFYISEAVCDMAQKCVMALMETCNIKKMRILNLSDVMTGNLLEAKKLMGDEKIQMLESIFSPERSSERALVMPCNAVCFISWGTDNKLKDLKKQAIECLEGYNLIGEPVDEKNFSYRYIKPRGKLNQEKVIGTLAIKYLNM